MNKEARFRTDKGEIVAGVENIQRLVQLAKDKGGEWKFTLSKWSGSKTLQQIRTVQGVIIPGISEYTGETIKEVKRRLKIDYGVTEIFEKDGERYMEIKSFADYSKEEMKQFIDLVLNHCEHDLGFIIDLETRKKLVA